MVRVNLVEPLYLADQHLVAEYDEILMLLTYIKKHSDISDIPPSYRLGKGHMKFFKNKLLFLKRRHDRLKVEMTARQFVNDRTVDLKDFDKWLINDWTPNKQDIKINAERIIERLRQKPDWYRYYRKKDFGVEKLIKEYQKYL